MKGTVTGEEKRKEKQAPAVQKQYYRSKGSRVVGVECSH